jgi:hypothetical protein
MSGSLSAGTATSALGVGIALHLLVFKNIELEVYLPPFVGVSLLSFGGLIYHHVFFDNGSTITSLSRGLSEVLCVALGIFCSMAVYRIFFHSIRKVPGPFWAGLTRFYALYLSAKNVQYHVEITKMHEKYGDFIRTGKAANSSRVAWTRSLTCSDQDPERFAFCANPQYLKSMAQNPLVQSLLSSIKSVPSLQKLHCSLSVTVSNTRDVGVHGNEA